MKNEKYLILILCLLLSIILNSTQSEAGSSSDEEDEVIGPKKPLAKAYAMQKKEKEPVKTPKESGKKSAAPAEEDDDVDDDEEQEEKVVTSEKSRTKSKPGATGKLGAQKKEVSGHRKLDKSGAGPAESSYDDDAAKKVTTSRKSKPTSTETDDDEEDDEISSLVRRTGKLAIPSKHFNLERHDSDENLLAIYTDEISPSPGRHFSLRREKQGDRLNPKSIVALLDNFSERDGWKNHLMAQSFCYNAGGINETFLNTTLNFSEIVSPKKPLIIDWVSHASKMRPPKNFYFKKTDDDIVGGHSEPQFIADFEALWNQDSDSLLNLLLPPAVLKDENDVFMTGLELFGSLDMCDTYDCIGKLKELRSTHQLGPLKDLKKNHEKGQKSISQCIRTKLGDKFKGNPSAGFVLIYHAAVPYDRIHTYQAAPEIKLTWNNKGPKKGFIAKSSLNPIDTFSQHARTAEAQDVLFGHIHCISSRTFSYNETIKGFKL